MATSSSSSCSTRNGNVSVTSINCGEMDLSVGASSTAAVATATVLNSASGQQQHPIEMTTTAITTATVPQQLAVKSPFFNATGGSIRISVPTKIEESDVDDEDDEEDEAEADDDADDEVDPELSKIEKEAAAGAVNMRKDMLHQQQQKQQQQQEDKNGPRPMSWEGELSENEESNLLERIKDHNHHHQERDRISPPPLLMDAGGVGGPGEDNGMEVDGKVVLVNGGCHGKSPPFNEPNSLPIKKEKSDLITVKPEFLERNLLLSKATAAAAHAAAVAAAAAGTMTGNHHHNKFEVVQLKYEQDLGAPLQQQQQSQSSSSHLRNQQSPQLLVRSKSNLLPANPSPDSAIHSVYTHSSPSQSPLTSRHNIYTPSLSRNNSDASHSSCYSYSSEFSPTHSPIQGRHLTNGGSGGLLYNNSLLYRPSSLLESSSSAAAGSALLTNGTSSSSGLGSSGPTIIPTGQSTPGPNGDGGEQMLMDSDQLPASAAGISRQQLINSPCPICGDKISGFHYGIFSCESCKGFFKRTVQNRKNYVCIRGAACPVTIATRKKCPACRFEKCLQRGMKLEAIREDRTRGGRSTYQCSFTLPGSMLSSQESTQSPGGGGGSSATYYQNYRLSNAQNGMQSSSSSSLASPSAMGGSSSNNNNNNSNNSSLNAASIKKEDHHYHHHHHHHHHSQQQQQQHQLQQSMGGSSSSSLLNSTSAPPNVIPQLLQEIMDVEHLWQLNEAELSRLHQPSSSATAACPSNLAANPLLASAGIENGNTNPDVIANLCNIADHRLYKIVKWCKSLPLFKHISIDDQICLLINSWCELLLFSCCYRSVGSPGEIRISLGKSITLAQAKSSGLQVCIERMLNLTDHLRRLRVDRYEYVAMKVIVLLQSDTSELKEPEKVRTSQEKALQALQSYTLSHYPESPAKFGELLLRIPELQRTCQVGKEMLTIRSNGDGEFNLLMELLRGEH